MVTKRTNIQRNRTKIGQFGARRVRGTCLEGSRTPTNPKKVKFRSKSSLIWAKAHFWFISSGRWRRRQTSWVFHTHPIKPRKKHLVRIGSRLPSYQMQLQQSIDCLGTKWDPADPYKVQNVQLPRYKMCKVDPVRIGSRLPRYKICLLYTSPSPRDMRRSRMPSSA